MRLILICASRPSSLASYKAIWRLLYAGLTCLDLDRSVGQYRVAWPLHLVKISIEKRLKVTLHRGNQYAGASRFRFRIVFAYRLNSFDEAISTCNRVQDLY